MAHRAAVRRVARRFQPRSYARGYANSKLRLDPAYRAIVDTLDDVALPLLDIGCGMGLLGMYLHERGMCHDYVGIDIDSRKLRTGGAALAGAPRSLRLRPGDAGRQPPHLGNVVLLDVLHYLPLATQRDALEQAASRVAADGVLVIRTCLADGSWRFRSTLLEEWVLHMAGWMRRDGTRHMPRREQIETVLQTSGFHITSQPMWGMTPFNSYLFVARRQQRESNS